MLIEKDLVASGSSDTTIHNHDVRIAEHKVATLTSHSEEICGLKWSNTLLASGGNDDQVNIWDLRRFRAQPSGSSSSTINPTSLPLFTLRHSSAVKAIAWCPFQSNLLATGGGSSDRAIHFWNTYTGVCMHSVNTHSQVCFLFLFVLFTYHLLGFSVVVVNKL